MRELEKYMFARSLAGHDKGVLHVIVDTEDPFVYLADGKSRTIDSPKKKKRKHIQPDYEISSYIKERTEMDQPVRDEDIRKAIQHKEGKNV